jgi:hypothetical protein
MEEYPKPEPQYTYSDERPFKLVILVIMVLCGFASLAGMMSGFAFLTGIFLSLMWACIVYGFNLDQPHPSPIVQRGRASLGFFCIIVGVVIGVIGPNYLNAQPKATEWFVIFGLLIGSSIGLPLLLTIPMRSLSVWGGYLAAAIVLHSVLLSFPGEFVDIDGAKVLVLVLLCISIWFFGQWLFFDKADPLTIEESKRVKGVKSFVGVASGLVTVIEFINILYTLFRLTK